MAVKIEFMGYVNRVREYEWGVVYDMAHNQMKKTNDQWQTVGRDYFSVVGVEGGERFAENDMVNVKGTLKTKYFDKQDGSKGLALNVRAEEMVKQATSRSSVAKPETASVPDMQQIWPDLQQVPEDNAPF
jgi:hypothetical protein